MRMALLRQVIVLLLNDNVMRMVFFKLCVKAAVSAAFAVDTIFRLEL